MKREALEDSEKWIVALSNRDGDNDCAVRYERASIE